jgi:hypothetical protein
MLSAGSGDPRRAGEMSCGEINPLCLPFVKGEDPNAPFWKGGRAQREGICFLRVVLLPGQ